MQISSLFRHSFKLLLILTMLLLYSDYSGQTKSRLKGSVVDTETGESLLGVNILIQNTFLGAATDLDGNFIIVNVPVGTYNVKISMVGYKTQIIENVLVSADRVTSLDIKLLATTIEGSEVIVIADRTSINKEVSNTQMVVSADQLKEAPGTRDINSFLRRLPGVSQENGFLTIRGGSPDQTGSLVNGLSYVNAAVGNAETSIPLSAVNQVSVLEGGYNAEYGNFRSGLINITTKSGTNDGYHGTISITMDQSHQRRFGDSFYDTDNAALKSYLDPSVAFIGTEAAWADDPYMREQNPKFSGWDQEAENWNRGLTEDQQVTPLDLYLFAAWMHMAKPDYEGLAKLGYTVSDEQKQLFSDHRMQEDGNDWNIDGGFGGPVPLIGSALGNATFYISHNSKERHYIMPLTLSSENLSTTFATVKAQPWKEITITYNGLWKTQYGLSPIRPPWGDIPNAGNAGGFMQTDNIRYQARNPDYWYDQALFPILNQDTYMNGITVNYVMNSTTFMELTVGHLNIQNSTETGDNRDTSVVTSFGPITVDESPYNKLQDVGAHRVGNFKFPSYDTPPGVQRRFRRKEGNLYDNSEINQMQAKFDITSQLNQHNYFKAGIEYNYIDIDHKFWEKWNENAYNTYEFNYHRFPSQTGLYIQDQISYKGIIANLGVRFDYYYGGGGDWPTGDPFSEEVFRPQEVDTSLFSYLAAGNSYIWDIWKAYDEENPGFLQPVENHFTFSPRVGVSFPISVQSKFYFNYGQFRSNPPYYSMYLFKYRYDKQGLYEMSNPNLEPPRTTSFELGLTYNFYQSYILTLSGYYKDVTGQTGEVSYQNAAGTLNYDNVENNNYEDIQGFEITVSKIDNSWFNMWINFNYMLKKSGLTGRSVITDITINNDQAGLYQAQESRAVPQPRLNASFTFRSPESWRGTSFTEQLISDWNMTIFGEWRSGGYFTYNPLGDPHLNNNLQWPDYYMVDLKLSKTFNFGGVQTTFFLDVNNLLNLEVSLLSRGYAFADDNDELKYLGSLQLPMYDSPEFDAFRENTEGYFIAGDDKVGDLRSEDKPYINDPNLSLWLYGFPRDIWFGFRVDF